ncbi:hypothetical protein [Flavobacterium sp. GSA192]|uniref:hypothetical protein n=1 Tax=Flavobacterium sp. GSA192 TaxID=2576304 RepID=UPI00112728DB|nr:hypothetical protein [Flavobacterium sp. GSA192]
MKNIYHYDSVSKALDELNENGFNYDFNQHEDEILKNPNHYEIKHIYRYEGESNPDDEAIVYGIQCKTGKKGVYVSGFAANSITEAGQILLDISIKSRRTK